MSGTGSSVFDITQSLGADDAGRIKRLLEGGVKIPAQPRVPSYVNGILARKFVFCLVR